MDRKVEDFLLTALEASVYLAPLEPGLTAEELREVGRPLGFESGEISDGLRHHAVYPRYPDGTFHTTDLLAHRLLDFEERDPDPRNVPAFDFVRGHLQQLARKVGKDKAKLTREALVAAGVAQGLDRHALEVAVTCSLISGTLAEGDDGAISNTGPNCRYDLASAIRESHRQARFPVTKREFLRKLLPLVQDVLSRRTDGRPKSAEPLVAFEKLLPSLGHAYFTDWWKLNVKEFQLADAELQPTTVTVLAAALCEGALTFIVNHAEKTGLAMPGLPPTDPQQWKFDKLIEAAKRGPHPIFTGDKGDAFIAERALQLNFLRQRIHAGRIIKERTKIPRPDIRPEEARAAKETVDQVLRKILDWLDKHPVQPGS